MNLSTSKPRAEAGVTPHVLRSLHRQLLTGKHRATVHTLRHGLRVERACVGSGIHSGVLGMSLSVLDLAMAPQLTLESEKTKVPP